MSVSLCISLFSKYSKTAKPSNVKFCMINPSWPKKGFRLKDIGIGVTITTNKACIILLSLFTFASNSGGGGGLKFLTFN